MIDCVPPDPYDEQFLGRCGVGVPDRGTWRGRPSKQPPVGLRCYRGRGCSRSAVHGTRGRSAVVEWMKVCPRLRRAISTHPPLDEPREVAFESGLISMRESALELARGGIIPLSELPRLLTAERMAPERPAGAGAAEKRPGGEAGIVPPTS